MEFTPELIQRSDTSELLRFELENRAWFEQFIPPRLESFYSLTGVQSHIESFLEEYQNETLLPMLLRTSDGQICGRLNLSMDDAEPMVGVIGYRVGKAFVRQGIATKAVKFIKHYAPHHTQVTRLQAMVLTSNVGSSKALENNGFQSGALIRNFAMLNGRPEHAREYVWTKG